MQRFESRVRKYFYTVGVVIMVIGILVSFILAYNVGRKEVTTLLYRTSYERDWGLTIGAFIAILIPSVFSGALLIAISEVLEALEVISDNTANLGIGINGNPTTGACTSSGYNYGKAFNNLSSIDVEKSSKSVTVGSWICPDCGKSNHSFDQICSSCGAERK